MTSAKKSATRRTYIEPFKDIKRLLVYLGTFLGIYGFAVLNVVSSYDLASAGFESIAFFFAPGFVAAGFIYYPLLYMGFSAFDGLKWRLFLALTQLVSLVLFLVIPQDPLLRGIVSGNMMSPYWCAYHIAMVQNTSSENRGYEVSLGIFISMGSSFMAALTSGTFLELGGEHAAIIIALSTMMLGTICLMSSMRYVRQHTVKAYIKECKKVAHDNPYMMRRIISQSLYDIPTLSAASIMFFVGISPTIMATILIARLIVMALIMPAIGTMAHTYRKHGFTLGLVAEGLAWTILIIQPSSPYIFLTFMIMHGIGQRLCDSNLLTGLYEMQSYASMMWSEAYMSIGRALSLIFIVPLLYYQGVTTYLAVLASISFTLIPLNRRWQKKWHDAQAM